MYIGIGIFMLVVGAILRYAVTAQVSWINLNMVGVVLMWGGVLAIAASVLYSVVRNRSTRYSSTRTQSYDPTTNTATERTDVDPY